MKAIFRRYLAPVLISLASIASIVYTGADAQVINPSQPATGVPVAGTGISVAGQTVSVNYGLVANTSLQGNALHAPTAIGDTTPSTGAFTTLSATSTVSGAGITSLFASPPPIGSTAAGSGAFTTLANSGTLTSTGAAVLNGAVSGTGIATYEANINHVQSVLNVTALRALTCVSGLMYQTQGYTSAADGGSALYQCNGADTTTTDNGCNFIASAGGARFYLQLPAGAPLSVKQCGAVGNNVANDTTAITNANTAAIAANRVLFFPNPSVAYSYQPAGLIAINHWRGEDQYFTIINVANAYAGEVVRLVNAGNSTLEEMTIQTPGLTKTAGSIGVRVAGSAANTTAIGVNAELRRVYIRGFDHDLQIENIYLLHADHVHVESGNYGVYVVPDPAGNGYVTAHNWVNCDFGHNGVNVYYNPANYSNTVSFFGGNISDATGAYQSYFNKVRILKFINMYFENSPTIRALNLVDTDYVSVDNAYFNNTGGIQVAGGTPTRLELKNSWSTTATDIITGADGNQYLSVHNSQLPSSGNSAIGSWKNLVAENTDYNGVRYGYLARGQSFGFLDNFQSGGGTTTPNLNAGNNQRITVTDTTAFAVGVPSNAIPGQMMIVTVQNSSGGGTLGTITWNAVFKLQAAWVSPASGFNRSIIFVYDGNVWHEISRTTADVAN